MSIQTITLGTFIILMFEQGQYFAQARLYHVQYVAVYITDFKCLGVLKTPLLFYWAAQN